MMQEVGYCSGIENYSRYLSGREAGEPPPCLYDYLPRQRAAGRRREPPDHSAARRDVPRRPLAQGDAGGVRLSSALGARQPAAEVRGVGAARAADDLRLGDARPVRGAQVRAGGRAGGAAHGPGRSGGRGAPGAHAGGRSAVGDPPLRRAAASACWSRRSPSAWPRI